MTTDERLELIRERIGATVSDLRQRRLGADFEDDARADHKVNLIEQAEDKLEEAAELLARALTVKA